MHKYLLLGLASSVIIVAFIGATLEQRYNVMETHPPTESSSDQSPAESTQHVTLIGDSILDNKAYVKHHHPSVSQLLRKKVVDLGLDWKVTLCAIDGDVMGGVPRQLQTVPKSTSVLVLSIGGNDGLRYLYRLDRMGMRNPLNVIRLISQVHAEFTAEYSATLDRVLELGMKVVVCTVYYPCFNDWFRQKVSCAGLYVMNGIIISEAAKRGLPVIDLAAVFDKEEDYANPIEPGVMGADKLTANIIRVVRDHSWEEGHRVYADRTYSVESADDLRDPDVWRCEARAVKLGRWDWEVTTEGEEDEQEEEDEEKKEPWGDLPDLKDNDPFRKQ